jgi:hypothetical protein
VGFQERLLDQVRGIDLALEPTANLQPGQQGQIAAVPLQQLAQGTRVARSGPLYTSRGHE